MVSLTMSQVIAPEIAADVKSVISNPVVANTVTKMGTSIASGVLTGKTESQILDSVVQTGTGAIVNFAANDILKNTPGLNDPSIPPEAKQVALAGITGALTTGDGTKSMVNAAIAAGTKDLLTNAGDVLHPEVVATLQDTHDTAKAADSSAPAATDTTAADQAAADQAAAEKQAAQEAHDAQVAKDAKDAEDRQAAIDKQAAEAQTAKEQAAAQLAQEQHDAQVAKDAKAAEDRQAAIDKQTADESAAETARLNAADQAAAQPAPTVSAAAEKDFNSLVAAGVDSNTALSTVMDWHASGDTQQVSDNTPVDDSVLPTNNQAVASGMGPGSAGAQEAAAGNLSQDEMAAAQGVDTSGLDTSGLDALNAQNVRTAGSSPGSEEAATRLTDPKDLLAAGAGASGSLPTALGNEAVASGMSPGSLGAQAAADNSLLDSQQSAAYGTSNVADLTGGNTAANNLAKSSNEAVASGMSPGSAGAAQAAAGMLTDNQLAAATGTNNPVPSPLPTVKTPTTPAATTAGAPAATTTGALPTTNTLSTATTQSVIPGQLLHLGKMGSDMTPHQLKQLYAELTATPTTAYNYVNDVNPETLNIAQLESQPFQQPQQPMYAHGGLVQHFAEGDQPDPTQGFNSLGDLSKSLKNAADYGAISKIYRPTVLTNGNVGAQYAPKVLPQLASLLQSRGMHLAGGGQPDDHTHPNYDGTPLLRTGGLSGLGGKYVEGKGDGTSDDIAAMLANGEYVFSADVVSALGNGSNKAGAEELDHMVQAIRARARSAPPDKLPPDAKSPLEYLKSSKGKKNG